VGKLDLLNSRNKRNSGKADHPCRLCTHNSQRGETCD